MSSWLAVFFIVPIAEMYLLLEVGGYIGAPWTIALVMFTAVVGVALLRRQGVATLTRGMSRLQQGEVPATEMAEGVLLAVAGALLLTPGFVTDSVGFGLLIPALRGQLVQRLISRIDVASEVHVAGTRAQGNSPGGPGRTIEGEFEPRR